MYAVVKTGGKQYRVAKDDKIIVDHIEAEAGDHIILDQVLMMVDGQKVNTGTPTLTGAAVGATVLRQTRGAKIMVFRRKRRKNFRRLRGHRQDLTLIQITDIAPDGAIKPPVQKKEQKAAKPKAEAKQAASKTEAKGKTEAKQAADKTEAKKAAKSAPKKD